MQLLGLYHLYLTVISTAEALHAPGAPQGQGPTSPALPEELQDGPGEGEQAAVQAPHWGNRMG